MDWDRRADILNTEDGDILLPLAAHLRIWCDTAKIQFHRRLVRSSYTGALASLAVCNGAIKSILETNTAAQAVAESHLAGNPLVVRLS